jgi:hypothetical protein
MNHPRGKGGGGAYPKSKCSDPPCFVVEAVEAVEAVHGVLVVQAVEDVARKRTRCGSWCGAACN